MAKTGLERLFIKRVESADPDGSECVCCGDRIFLKAYTISVYWGDTSEKIGGIDGLICDGCIDICRDRFNLE